MAFERIAYPELPWTAGGHPLEQKKTAALGRATLLRFRPGFADLHGCSHGHAGYVIEGRLLLDVAGESHVIRAGEGFVVEPGTLHHAANTGDAEVVVFVATYDASAAAGSSSR